MTSDNKKSRLKTVIQLAPLAMAAVMAVVYLTALKDLKVADLLTYTPENLWLAAGFIIIMFALKSLSFFFPMLIIHAVSGHIFTFPVAVAVNIIGTAVMVTIPYLIGRYAQRDLVDSLISKSKKADRINEFRNEGQLFVSFFLRVINCLPCDLVSMALGAGGVGYKKYLIGSLLGILPGIISVTLMGDNVADPLSPMFIGSAVFEVITALVSAAAYYFYRKKKKMKH
ncbi:MAG: TVP38/TMEM64 family protein [Oscillospiraceae bacterium]|nr:TVP38/TMEM64 family protein [Oscillospiraceae bacterium]